MTAPTLIGTPTTNEAQASSIAAAAPSGVAAGDHQLVFLCVFSTSETVTTPSGWTPVGAQNNTTSSVTFRLHCFRSTTVTGSQTFAKSGSAACYVTRIAYRGGPGFESWAGDGGSGSSVNHPLPTMTTTVADSRILGVLAEGTSTGSAAFSHDLSGWTEEFDWSTSTAIGRRGMMAGYSLVKASPGAQGGTIVSSTSGHGATLAVVLTGYTAGPAAPTVNAGADVTGQPVGSTFTRTATEGGGTPTSRAWTIVSGPTGAGTTIGTAAALSWAPTQAGTYVLRYTASNTGGSASDDMQITVAAITLDPVDVIPFGLSNGLVHYAFDIGVAGEAARVLHDCSELAAGLNLDPEFTAVTDTGVNWVQTAVRADAPKTSGTTNPRAEGRETAQGSDTNLAFTPQDGGTHWQRFRARVMEHPLIDNVGIATGQLHSLQDDTVMVRTRYSSSTGLNRLVLRVYDPPTDNSVDVLTLDDDYAFGDVYDILLLVHGSWCYVFHQDFTRWAYRFPTSILPATGTYMLKWGCYIQGTASWPTTAYGRVHYRNVAHFHDGWAAPTGYFGAPTAAVGSAAAVDTGAVFARTATETGSGIVERRWAILDGPEGAGTEIGTAAALSWTPATPGDYVLMYGARNGEGWSNPTFLPVTVATPAAGGPASVRDQTTGVADTASTSHTITLPNREVGDALIVAFANDESADPTLADPDAASQARGWSTWITEEQGTSTNHRFTLFYKAAAEGGSADNLTVTLAFAQEATWVAHSIADADGPPQSPPGMDEGGATSPVLGVPYTGLTPSPWLSLIYLGTDASTTTAQNPSAPSGSFGNVWTRIAGVNPGTTSSAATFAWSCTLPPGTTEIDPGTITLDPPAGEQWVRYHVIFPGSSAVAPTVGAGADASIDQYATLSRTATEDNGGATITSRAWTVVSGPNQVGATIGTAAALSWAPTVGGVYVLRYTAGNSAGSGHDDLVVTVAGLVFPVTATLALSATPAVARATGPIPVTAGPLPLSAAAAGQKQAILDPVATLALSASITGKRINSVQALLRLSASIQASSNQGAFVTARMRLGASLSDVARDTPAVDLDPAPLHLAADVDTSSDREPAVVDAALPLAASFTGQKQVALEPAAMLHLAADVADVVHTTPVALTAPLTLSAALSERFHTGGDELAATLRLAATVATSSTRAHRVLPTARLRLFGNAIGQRIIAAITAVTPRADTTVRYDLVAVARIPQAGAPPVFVEVDPIDWTDISWTEELNASPTLSATAKISTLTEPILQRLQVPHELPTELWAYRNGKAVFAGPLLGSRVGDDSISLEAGGIETYLRWMHVVNDRQFVDADQFSIVRALIDQWQGLEYGHFGIDSGSGQMGLLPDPIPGQATYQASNRTAENSDDDLKVTRPSGTKAGDLLVVAHVCDTDGGLTAMTAPDGWTQIGEQTGTSDIPNLKIWTKTATESEPSSYTFGQDDQDGALGILRIDGHNGVAPVAVQPVFASSSSSSSSHVAPSVAGVAGGLLITVACADTGGSRRVYSQAPTGMEERVDIGANSAVLGMFTQPLTAAGATGTKTAICSGSHDWIAAALVIAPAPPTPPPLVDYGPLSGVTRSVSYFASELHNVADRIGDLAKAADGFNVVIDPTTRRLELWHPTRGIDRSEGEDAIVFDARNLASSDIAFSIAPGDLASDGFATGSTGGTDSPRTATYANLELRAKFGRTGVTGTFEASDQASLDAYVAALVDARDQVLLIPGPNARVTLDADLSSYDVGDTISYHAHSRLTTATAWRIRKRTVRVGSANSESVAIEFV